MEDERLIEEVYKYKFIYDKGDAKPGRVVSGLEFVSRGAEWRRQGETLLPQPRNPMVSMAISLNSTGLWSSGQALLTNAKVSVPGVTQRKTDQSLRRQLGLRVVKETLRKDVARAKSHPSPAQQQCQHILTTVNNWPLETTSRCDVTRAAGPKGHN
ncbi:hypothetical protein RRG08_008193 [Elysia crispata]|uniref:Uncharacterized protein n=1 Tax=Elysia crispata TaxID=231223 RepID=A0AAE1A765_9GAST|nr:hypothetical protein RRG08_008193 [Elysia crispata]